MNTCVNPARDTPIIFPVIKLNGLTEEIIISIILLVFSSITLIIIMLPYAKMKKYKRKPRKKPKISETRPSILLVSSPSKLSWNKLMKTLDEFIRLISVSYTHLTLPTSG